MLVNACFCVALSLILHLQMSVRDGDHARICSRQYACMLVTICASARRQEIFILIKTTDCADSADLAPMFIDVSHEIREIRVIRS